MQPKHVDYTAIFWGWSANFVPRLLTALRPGASCRTRTFPPCFVIHGRASADSPARMVAIIRSPREGIEAYIAGMTPLAPIAKLGHLPRIPVEARIVCLNRANSW
jgi:hypothetical protein